MGSRQENWLQNSLNESGYHWLIIGSQIGMSSLIYLCYYTLTINTISSAESDLGVRRRTPFNVVAWDGYLLSKNRTLYEKLDQHPTTSRSRDSH